MPNSPKTRRMLALAVAGMASYWVLPFFATGLALQVAFNSLVFGIATAILITWGPAAVLALGGGVTGENQNIIAVTLLWFVIWAQRLYSIAFVILDRPVWLMNSVLPAFLAYLIGVVGVLFLSAPATLEDTPKTYYWHLGVAGVFGAMSAAVSYYLQLHGFDQ